jgi:hypothetical protein
MRLIDADAFDNVLKDAQTECKKNGGNFRFGVLNNVRANLAKAPTIRTERLAKATAEAEEFMSKAPYLCYDLANELIEAAKEVIYADKG